MGEELGNCPDEHVHIVDEKLKPIEENFLKLLNK
jgi:hypothetical protein